MTLRPIDAIQSYHAHVYFDGPEQTQIAKALRDQIAERFFVMMGRWWDRPTGPHARPMYQVAFQPAEFARIVPWLMINRRGLTIFVHPNTRRPRDDHFDNALWLGEILELFPGPLADEEGPEPPLAFNTRPTMAP